jgi:hypothetical protein
MHSAGGNYKRLHANAETINLYVGDGHEFVLVIVFKWDNQTKTSVKLLINVTRKIQIVF